MTPARLVLAIAAGTLLACSGDGRDTTTQDEVADLMIEALRATTELEGLEGVEIDDGCVRERLRDLTEADARAILDTAPGAEPQLSAAGDEIVSSTLECIDVRGLDLSELGR